LEFDQAVGYLNKIKERFSSRPEVYKEFLSILGNYQRITSETGGSVSIVEFFGPPLSRVKKSSVGETSEVYEAVARLFREEEDLMRDFKSFLPDTVMGTEKVVRSEKRAIGMNDSSLKVGKKRPGEGVAAGNKVGK